MNVIELGWNSRLMDQFEPFQAEGLVPARVTREHKGVYAVYFADGEQLAEVSGKLRHDATTRSDFPAVGDWVAIQARPGQGKATIHGVLPRKGVFVRKEAGEKTEEQVVVANVDTVFLVSGLDGDFNFRRIERYLTVAWNSGATPVVVLNKADLCGDVDAAVLQVEAVAFGVPVLAVSASRNQGVDGLREHFGEYGTAAFLGSSGVGKSTLINAMVGVARQEVRAVRENDSRGRHTTTYRELIPLPGGGVLIDTPGMRELRLWTDENGLGRAFDDIERLATHCRFRDCAHEKEPGCAVAEALAAGALDASRWRSYLKLKRELKHLAARQDHKAQLAEKAKDKEFGRMIKRMKKHRQKW